MTIISGFLISRDGRELFMRELPEWAELDSNYTVTALGPIKDNDGEFIPYIPENDDTQERIKLMNELFELQETEINQLKQRLEQFVEMVEGIVELTEVVSHSDFENRSKLLVISKSCKDILKSRETLDPAE